MLIKPLKIFKEIYCANISYMHKQVFPQHQSPVPGSWSRWTLNGVVGFKPWPGLSVVFLDTTLFSYGASLLCNGLAYHPQ